MRSSDGQRETVSKTCMAESKDVCEVILPSNRMEKCFGQYTCVVCAQQYRHGDLPSQQLGKEEQSKSSHMHYRSDSMNIVLTNLFDI